MSQKLDVTITKGKERQIAKARQVQLKVHVTRQTCQNLKIRSLKNHHFLRVNKKLRICLRCTYAILIKIQGNTNRLLEEKKGTPGGVPCETKKSKKFHSKVAEELKKENKELTRGVARLAERNENFTSTVTKLQQRLEDIETQQDEM